jgi:hypothetical protein
MLHRRRGICLLTGLIACLSLIGTAEAGKVRVLTRVIYPVYHSKGKDGPPVRLIQYQKPKPPIYSQPSPSDPPKANSQPKPHEHHEPYPFAFDQFDRYPGGYYTQRYPMGYYLGGYRYPESYPYYDYAPRIYGAAPLAYEPVVYNNGLIPYAGPYGYAGGAWGWGGGFALGGYAPFNLGIYSAGYGYGYRFGPSYPAYAAAYAPAYGGYYPAPYYGPYPGNPYFGATQLQGLGTYAPADGPLVP